MSTKRPGEVVKPNSAHKRSKVVMTLEKKLELLDKLQEGLNGSAVGRLFNVSESTVRSIKKNEKNIRDSVKSGTPTSIKVSRIARDPNIENMEKALNVWIDEQNQKNVPISTNIVTNKARTIYQELLASSGNGGPSNFAASKGWFFNFKRRYNLHNIKWSLPTTDNEATSGFSGKLKSLINEKGYSPDQVFSANETGLFWKRMPEKTFISKEENLAQGFKAAEDKFTLLLCANASGKFMVKPMLVYRSSNPQALNNKSKSSLPVFWRSNEKALVTPSLFMDWFENCFTHEVQLYLRSKNLPFTILLVLDHSPSHPEDKLMFAHPSIEVLFLPQNSPTNLQPLDQDFMKTFKSYYIRRTFEYFSENIKTNKTLSLRNAWKRFTVSHALTIIKDSLDEIKTPIWNAAWKDLWPDVVKVDVRNIPLLKEEIRRIIKTVRKLTGEGFDGLEEEDINELLNSHSQELSELELEEMIEEENVSGANEHGRSKITCQNTLHNINKFLQHAANLAEEAVEIDPFMERSLKFKQALKDTLTPYKELQRDLERRISSSTLDALADQIITPKHEEEILTTDSFVECIIDVDTDLKTE